MLKLEADKMRKAIERARAEHLKVKPVSVDDRTYAVTGKSGKTYTVRFVVVNGMKLAECSCPSAAMCKHICSAAQANIMCQSIRRSVVTQENEALAFIARNTGWLI